MIATISKETPKEQKKREEAGAGPAPKPCIVYWTGKGGVFSIAVHTYCADEIDADRGVMQVPDRLLHAGLLCDACTASYRKYEATIPVPTARPAAVRP